MRRQIFTHIIVAAIAYQFGMLMAASNCVPDLCFDSMPDAPILTSPTKTSIEDESIHNKAKTSDNPSHQISHPFNEYEYTKDFLHGISWVPREKFARNLVVGFPLEKNIRRGNDPQGAAILYTTKDSLPNNYTHQNDLLKTIDNVDEAVQNCDEVSVIVSDLKRRRRCIALYENWGRSSHIYRFFRDPVGTGRLRFGSKYDVPKNEDPSAPRWVKPPIPSRSRQSLDMLSRYLEQYPNALKKLEPIAKKVSEAGENKAVIVMTVNNGQSHLLFNYVCAARRIKMDTRKILFFALDQETYDFATNVLGLNAFWDEKLFRDIPTNGSKEFGDETFRKSMMAKIYTVQMVNDLGYDLLFQDVDILPLRPDVLEYFYEKRNLVEDDFYFQYDKNRNLEQAPLSANSGFYFVKSNDKTKYFFSAFLRMGDLILQSGSHQQVMIHLLSEHMTTFGLRVIVMGGEGEDSDLFPSKSFLFKIGVSITCIYICSDLFINPIIPFLP